MTKVWLTLAGLVTLWAAVMVALWLTLGRSPEPAGAPPASFTLHLEACDDDRPNAPVRGSCVRFDDGTVALMDSPYGTVLAPLNPCGDGHQGVPCYVTNECDLIAVRLGGAQ